MGYADEYFKLREERLKKEKNKAPTYNELYPNMYATGRKNLLKSMNDRKVYNTLVTNEKKLADEKEALRYYSDYRNRLALLRSSSGKKTEDEDSLKAIVKGVGDFVGDVKDGLESVGHTILDVGEEGIKAIGELGEKVWDGWQSLAASDKTSAYMQARRELAQEALEKGKMPSTSYSETSKRAEEIVKINKEEAAKKIAKDLIQTDKIAFVDEEKSWLGDKGEAFVQNVFDVGARAALNLIPVVGTGLSIGTTGLSVLGGEVENAVSQGADFDKALTSGMISAAGEIGSEALFGAVKFGGKALFDGLGDAFTKKITNKALKTLAKWGFNATGEGVEEVLSGIVSAAGQKFTYANEKDFNELYSSEKAWEDFFGGVVLGGFFEGVNIGISKVKGVDYITGLSNKEKTVVDKVYQDRVAEKEKTTGKKLNTKEKTEIFDKVITEAKKGYISIDTIEEVLGGETYNEYKSVVDKEKSLTDEISKLENTPEKQITVKQSERLAQAREELNNLANKDELKTRLSDEVYGIVKNIKGGKLIESYNEKARKSQAFTVDLSQYEGKKREAVERAVNSGILNDSNRSHELVDALSNIEVEKGIVFDYANNEKLRESGFALEGKSVNAFVDKSKGAVTLNIQSAKAWESVVGHEITHILEGTDHYAQLKEALFTYAESKGELAKRRAELTKLYKGIDTDIDAELTADLVGDYLFSDSNFIKNLTKNKNVFKKVYDEIKYLCKVATGKQLTEIEKVRREFDNAWKELSVNPDAETDGKVNYSIAGVNAKTADNSLLLEAEKMLNKGIDSETVRQKTGWYKGYDGKMRFEIDDSNMDFNINGHFTNPDVIRHRELEYKFLTDTENITDAEIKELQSLSKALEGVKKRPSTLGDYLKHDKLFEAYPELKDYKLTFDKIESGALGTYKIGRKEIVLDNSIRDDAEKIKSTLAHEIQHAIQEIEGFANGSSVEYWKTKKQDIVDTISGARANLDLWLDDIGYSEFVKSSMQEVVDKKKTIEQHFEDCKEFKANSKYAEQIANCEAEIAEYQQQYDEITNGMTAYEQYQNTAGEIEARDVENRLNLNEKQRKNTRPDIDKTDVVFAEGTVSHYSAKESDGSSIKQQLREHLEEVNAMSPVATVNYTPTSKKNLRVQVVQEFKKIGYAVDRQGFGVIDIGENYINDSLDYLNTEAEKAALWAVPKVLKRGKEISGHKDHKGRSYGTVTIAAPVSINGKVGNVAVVVKMTGKNRYSTHRILMPDGSVFVFEENKNTGLTSSDMLATKGEQGTDISPVFNDKIPQNGENVKTDFSLSKQGEDIAPVGTPLKDLYLAPTKETVSNPVVTENAITDAPMANDAPFPNEIAPMTEEEANALQDEKAKADVNAEGQPKTRKQLHHTIIDNIKSVFSGKGFDFDEVLKNAKNLSTFSTVDNIPQRVMEKALGYKEGQALADLTVNKVAQNETEGIKWLNSFTSRKDGLLAQLSKQYNIKSGSKESAAAQMYAEGFYVNENNDIVAYGDAELAKDFPDVNVQNNIKGLANDPKIRRVYDETLNAINESRTRNAYPEIQRLENYFLHFRAMEDTFSKIGLPFIPNDIRAKDLPTDLNGVTADLKPGQPYFASAQHRTGKRTSFDLLGGLERYLTSAKNQIYHIDDIQTLRALRNYIADTYGQANGLEGIDALTEEEAQEKIEKVYDSHLSTFAKFLNEEANVLAGKTALIDRGLEGIIGRRGMTFFDTLNKQVGSNMVGFNISSSLTNFIPVAQTFAKTNKFDFIKAFSQTVSNKFGSIFGKGDNFAENSPVIIRRKGADRFYRTPFQKVGDAGYVLMSAVDDISTELIARTKFNELTRKGMSEQQAHFETDKWVSRLMGDRSLGQQPQLYNSKMLGVVTKFQLEVRNQLDSQFYDTIQEAKASNEDIENGLARNAKTAAKVTSTFLQLAVAQHLFGKAFESIAGYNPAFDIISVLATMFGFDDDEESEDTALDNIEQGFLELLEDLPYTSTFTGGRIPLSNALPVTELVKGTDSYGNEKPRWKTALEAAPYYLLPAGYGQSQKTIQGLLMFNTDEDHPIAGSYTKSGDLRFPVEDTFANRLKAGIFGQYANKNARDYIENGRKPLSEKQTQEFIDTELPIADYWKYLDGLKGLKPLDGKKSVTLNQKGDYIGGLDLPVSVKNILINNIADDRKTPIDFTGYENYSNFEEFDFATRYPEKYAVLKKEGISVSDYKKHYEKTAFIYTDDYSWAANNPEKYTFAKSVGGLEAYKKYSSELSNIKADKDRYGKSISGSRKEKVIDYINDLDADYEAKIILFKSEYPSDDTYNTDIINYINSLDGLTYNERVTIFKELGFSVKNGYVYWD